MYYILATSTVAYLNKEIVPILGGLVTAGLTLRMITKLIKARQDEEDSLKAAGKICRKYIGLIILTTVLSTLIYAIDSYYK